MILVSPEFDIGTRELSLVFIRAIYRYPTIRFLWDFYHEFGVAYLIHFPRHLRNPEYTTEFST